MELTKWCIWSCSESKTFTVYSKRALLEWSNRDQMYSNVKYITKCITTKIQQKNDRGIHKVYFDHFQCFVSLNIGLQLERVKAKGFW